MKSTNPEQNKVRLPDAGKNIPQLALYKAGEKKLTPRWIERHDVSPVDVRKAGIRHLAAKVALTAILVPSTIAGAFAVADIATEHSSVRSYNQWLSQKTHHEHANSVNADENSNGVTPETGPTPGTHIASGQGEIPTVQKAPEPYVPPPSQ